MKMPDSEAKKKWMKENTHVFSVKLMKKSEQDIIEYLEAMLERGIGKGTVLKLALREYMQNHPIDSISKNDLTSKPKTKFTYGMRLRGFAPGAQPKHRLSALKMSYG